MAEGFGSQTIGSIEGPNDARGQIKQKSPGVLTAPDNILRNIQGLKVLYFQYRGEHLRRIDLAAQIEGLLSGNPPYDPAELKAAKLEHITNFNNLDGRAYYEREAASLWNLLVNVEEIAKFEIKQTRLFKGAQPAQLVEWAQTLALHFDAVVRSWQSYSVNFCTLAGQLTKFGLVPVLWPDERDWRWRTVEYVRFFAQDQAQSDLDLMTNFCVETFVTAQYLWEVYEKFKDEPDGTHPWNIDELSNLLVFLANQWTKNQYNFYSTMDIQQRVQNGDVSYSGIFTDSIQMVSMLQQEYDGAVTHYMFHPFYDSGEILYFADRQYEAMRAAMRIFTASPGEFTLHSNRGVGHKVFSPCQGTNMLDCSLLDMGLMATTPLVESAGTGTPQDMEAIRFMRGIPTNIGNKKFVTNTLGANTKEVAYVSQYIDSKLERNLTNAGDNPAMPDKAQGSSAAPQVEMESYREFGVKRIAISHFYEQYDSVIENMVIRMLKSKKGYPGYEYAEEWKERCLDDGVPPEVFQTRDSRFFGMPAHLKVKTSRVAGDGSVAGLMLGLKQMQVLVPSMGPNEARAFKRLYTRGALGPQYVAEFTQDSYNAEASSGDATVAGVENGIMRLGEMPVFSMANEHRAHMVTHIALGNDTIRRVQQEQLDTIGADKIMTVLVPHGGQHFGALKQDIFAKDFLKNIEHPWTEIIHWASLNRHNATKEAQDNLKKQQKAQEQSGAVMSDVQRKNLQTQTTINNANRMTDARIANQEKVTDARTQNEQTKTQGTINNKNLETQLKNQAEPAKDETLDQQKADVAGEPTQELRQQISNMNGVSPAPFDFS